MKKILLSSFLTAALTAGSYSQVTNNYAGNGSTGFGGTVGNGSLQIVNNSQGDLNFTFTRGLTDIFSNPIVIYFDSVAGGAASTSGFTDSADDLRRAISGFNGSNRSTLNFSSGFEADYALALDSSFAGLWSLGNPANFAFQRSAGLTPTGQNESLTFSFAINMADIGLTADSGQTFDFFTTYISSSAFRSTETFGASFLGVPAQGYNTFDAAGDNAFTSVPEPSTYALLVISALGLAGYVARRRAARR